MALVPCPASTGIAALLITKKEESCFPPFFYSIKANSEEKSSSLISKLISKEIKSLFE
jgi:hypothetical protein